MAIGPKAAVVGPFSVLERRGADRIDHARGRSLLEHLRGTREILLAWGQSVDIAWAGAFHSAYGTDAFGVTLFAGHERAKIVASIGERAEALAHAFGTVPRRSVLSWALHRFEDAPPHGLRREQGLAVVVIEIANHLEQARGPLDGGSGDLCYAGRLIGALTRAGWTPLPRLLGSDPESLTPAMDQALCRDYVSALRLRAEGRDEAHEALSRIARGATWLAEPQLASALSHLQRGHRARAQEHLILARHALDRWGTSWDKTRSAVAWRTFADQLQTLSDS